MADTNLCDGCSSGMSLLEGKHYDRHGFAIMSCQAHKYAATPPADAALADEVTENLVALVGRLSHQLSKATPGHRLPVKAMAYLEQIGFKFHVARHGGPEAATQGKEPETIWRWYALDHTGYCYGANPPSNLPERCCLTAFHRHMDATEAAAALRARAVPGEPPEWPEYHEHGMGCGIEDRGITDRYEACRYGFEEAVERCVEAFDNWLAASKAGGG